MGWVRTLYQLAVGWKGGKPELGAICFWLKNRRPSEWRDVQQIEQAVGMYIISDRPLTEDEWIEQRTKAQPQLIEHSADDDSDFGTKRASPALPTTED